MDPDVAHSAPGRPVEPDPDEWERRCWDTTHDSFCTCGADPDRAFEQGMDR